jgi:hypothetical protein
MWTRIWDLNTELAGQWWQAVVFRSNVTYILNLRLKNYYRRDKKEDTGVVEEVQSQKHFCIAGQGGWCIIFPVIDVPMDS